MCPQKRYISLFNGRESMDIKLKCLPVGLLPYERNDLVTRMMVKLFEQSPYLPILPKVSKEETIIKRTFSNIPSTKIDNNKIYLKTTTKKYAKGIILMDSLLENPENILLDEFKTSETFLKQYFAILKRIQPQETVINLLGPFSASQLITVVDEEEFDISDKGFRRFIYQVISIKALWFIKKIKEYSPKTKPIFVLEEPLFNGIGKIKKQDEDVTDDIIVHLLSRIVGKLHENGAAVCVQSFTKCDWQIPISAGVDMISFGAYDNPYNLSIIPDQVNRYLSHGGKINWAIVPTTSERVLKPLGSDTIHDRLLAAISDLVDAGVNESLVNKNICVSVQGDLHELPLIFAEKALILSSQVAKRFQII